ncbi:MAG TPA: ABC transporter ATP-binding protein, partial [Gemmataceae bacterium]
MDDVSSVQALITSQTLSILTDIGTALAVACLLLAYYPSLFLVVLTFLPPYVLIFRYFTRRIRAGTEEVRRRMDQIFGHLKVKIDGMLAVKAHAREDAEAESFAAQLDDAHGPRLSNARRSTAFSVLTQATSGAGAAVVFAFGASRVLDGAMTVGEVVAASALAALLFNPVARLADLASVFQQAGACVGRLGEILDRDTDVPEPADPVPLGRARGEVEFDRVHFGYHAGQHVLCDVSLKVAPGTKVAVVGPTGCGKTTLMNLLLRFHDPVCGEIRLDGVPLHRLSSAELRRQIGVVPQEAVIFHASLADNIRYGAPEAGDDRVEAAARAALVDGFARSLPQGYDTVVGEGAYRLSQGERQRVAIARAFCKDPALVVLDEATSSVDTAAEALIQTALARLLKGRTAFIVAHRLSTVLDADLIVVLERGRVVQAGPHAELIADAGGLYRRLFARQFDLAAEAALPIPSPRPAEEPALAG